MRRAPYSITLLLLSLCGGATLAPSAGAQRAQGGGPISPPRLRRALQGGHLPPGSYIRQPAATVEELVSQVQNDPVVAARYARLFHMSPEAVRLAFRNLRRSTLTHDEVMRVYYVHGDKLGYKLRRVRAGEPVFSLPNGAPVLVAVCGNPLRATLLPPSLALQIPDFSPTEEVETVSPPFPPVIAERLEAPAPFPIGPVVPPVLAEVTPNFVEETGVIPPVVTAAPNLFPLLLLPFLAFIPGGGGGTPSFPGPPPPPTPVPAVPEPSAYALMACAGVGLVLFRARAYRAVKRA